MYYILFFLPTVILTGSLNWLFGLAYIYVIGHYFFFIKKSSIMSMTLGIGELIILLSQLVVLFTSVFIFNKLGFTALLNDTQSLIILWIIAIGYVTYMVFIHRYYKIGDMNFEKVSSIIILVIIGLSIIVPLIGLLVG